MLRNPSLEVRFWGDRSNSLEASTINIFRTIGVMLENIEERLGGIDAEAHRKPWTTHTEKKNNE